MIFVLLIIMWMVIRVFFRDFVYGAGPFAGMPIDSQNFGPDGMGGMRPMDFGSGSQYYGNRYPIFGPVPHGMSPTMAQYYRSWRAGAIFRLIILVFVGLPCAIILFSYGIGVLGDICHMIVPRVPEALRPQLTWFGDVLVAIRNFIAPVVNVIISFFKGIFDWFLSLIRGFTDGGR